MKRELTPNEIKFDISIDKNIEKSNTENLELTEENIIENEKTIENEKIVLSSKNNYGDRKITIFEFKENKLSAIRIYETYSTEETYNANKELANLREDIEGLNTNDEKLAIYYIKVDLGADKDASYQDIYNKYTSILGAYEIIY